MKKQSKLNKKFEKLVEHIHDSLVINLSLEKYKDSIHQYNNGEEDPRIEFGKGIGIRVLFGGEDSKVHYSGFHNEKEIIFSDNKAEVVGKVIDYFMKTYEVSSNWQDSEL
jgi:hypothetical protein